MNCFFSLVLPDPTNLVTVDAAEARHAANSRRQKTGERVLLIDGRGGRAEAIIVAVDRSAMELRIESVGRIVSRSAFRYFYVFPCVHHRHRRTVFVPC